MSDDNQITTTSLDQGVNSAIKTTGVREEHYIKNKAGHLVADTFNPASDSKTLENKSWSLDEIERTISTDVMPTSKTKLAIWGLNASRKSDFRLKELTRRLDTQMRQDYAKDLNSGPITRRLRDFDIQSQAMRQITANATLGTYQFQKTQVLPYMRKSLALNYEKTNLLKKLVGGITRLEKSVVVKLEAIKLNTAATIPPMPSLFKRLKNAIRDKNIDRVATNFSNVTMDGYDDMYKKHVQPIFTKLHKKMTDTTPKGGVNGVINSVSRKLNNLRHSLQVSTNSDPKALTAVGRIQHAAIKVASKTLSAGVKLGQTVKLPSSIHGTASKILSEGTMFLDKLQPFGRPKIGAAVSDPLLEAIGTRTESDVQKLLHVIKEGQANSQNYQKNLLDHVTAIRLSVAPEDSVIKRLSGPKVAKTVAPKVSKVIKIKKATPAKATAAVKSALSKIHIPAIPKLSVNATLPKLSIPHLSSMIPTIKLPTFTHAPWHSSSTASSKPKVTLAHPTLLKSLTDQMGEHLKHVQKTTGAAIKARHDFVQAHKKASSKIREPSAATEANAHKFGLTGYTVDPVAHHSSYSKKNFGLHPTEDHKPTTAAHLFGSLPKMPIPKINAPKVSFGAQPHHTEVPKTEVNDGKTAVKHTSLLHQISHHVGEHLKKIHQATKPDKKVHPLIKKIHEKRQAYADRMANAGKVRKGSYEDLEAQKEKRNRLPLWGKTAAGAAVADAATPAAPAPGFGLGGTSLIELGGAALGFAGKKIAKGGWAATKFLGKKGFGLTKTVVPKVGKLGFSAAKLGTKFIAREGAGALRLGGKIGLKGGLGLLKMGGGLLKGASGIGLAAMAGDYFLQKSKASAGVKRAGGTLLSMAEYGAMGSIFGPIGTAVGAAAGALIANSDYVGKGLAFLAHRASAAGRGLMTRLFGQSAIVKNDGTVVQQEKLSVLGDLKSAFFGKKAQYSRSGELISPEHLSLVGDIKYGFQKLLFGDKFDNGEYKQGTSILSMMGKGVSDGIKSFVTGIKNLPSQIGHGIASALKGIKASAKYTKDVVVSGVSAIGTYAAAKAKQARDLTTAGIAAVGNAGTAAGNFASLSAKTAGNAASSMADYASWMTPTGFSVGASQAIAGWMASNKQVSDPSSPYYVYITEVLNAYGIKDRELYQLVTALETSQEKINAGKTKPFDDNDMAWQAGRFGFDSKNKDSVNYFKLWYKRRFLPGMSIIGKVLRDHKMTFDSALSADEKQIKVVTDEIKKQITTANLQSTNLEPSVQAYNKFAKAGGKAPDGVKGGTAIKTTPFDPRDPKNQGAASKIDQIFGTKLSVPGQTNSRNPYANDNDSSSQTLKAERKNAKLQKGKVTDQPEYKAAFAKLPPNLKKLVSDTKALQFVLWSTSIQHGADTAAKMFAADYSEGLDSKAYIRSIYQDRSKRFDNLSAADRTEAVSHLSQESNFAQGIADGNMPTMGQAYQQAGQNVISPDNPMSNIKAAPVTGSDAARVKDAFKYLTSKGYKPNAAAGILGNLLVESRLKTNAIGDSGKAMGIGQWHPDRRNNISKALGKRVESMDLHGQLDGVDWELRNGKGTPTGKAIFGELDAAPDAATASRLFMQKFEAPRDHAAGGKNDRDRAGQALGVLKTVGTDGSDVGKPQTAAPVAPAKKSTAVTPANVVVGKPETAQPGAKAAPHPITQSLASHAKSLDSHAAAIATFTSAMTKSAAAPPAAANHNSVFSPIVNNSSGGASSGSGFLTMSMKKASGATGRTD